MMLLIGKVIGGCHDQFSAHLRLVIMECDILRAAIAVAETQAGTDYVGVTAPTPLIQRGQTDPTGTPAWLT